jgi:hypothetical protein
MNFIKAEIDVKIKGFIVPEGIKEKLLYYFKEQKVIYEVITDFEVQLSNGDLIVIKRGFETDLCSVPPFLHSFLSNSQRTMKAYIVHDWIYKTDYKRDELGDKKGKAFADKEMLYIANQIEPKLKKSNYIRYLAVKLFGKSTYKRRN